MTITSSEIVKIINKPNNLRGVYEQHTDQYARIHSYRYYTTEDVTEDAAKLAAHALKVDANLAPIESDSQTVELQAGGEEALPEYQTQADIDRRTLGRLMLEDDPRVFLNGLEYFIAVELRGGSNANARATYLGIPRAEYDLISKRFGDVQGAAFFINDDKGQIWEELPPGYF